MSNERSLRNRRLFLKSSGLLMLSSLPGCAMDRFLPEVDTTINNLFGSSSEPSASEIYAPVKEGSFQLQGIPYKQVPRRYRRQTVANRTGEAPDTIVVDTKNYFLYYTLKNGDAVRYGVGVGRAGFSWSGRAKVQYKRKWPVWTPPAEMIQRRPELIEYKNGMEPGPKNPLGARALYIYQNNSDTGYRIHGSPEWWSIGKSMSSGCIRLINQDIIDLYTRVKSGTPIIVL